MRTKVIVAAICIFAALAVVIAVRPAHKGATPAPVVAAVPEPTPASPAALRPRPGAAPRVTNANSNTNVAVRAAQMPSRPLNKADRLTQVRETFRTLAAGDPAAAMRAAKQLGDGNEREAALLELATQWTHGELNPALQRAWNIQSFGIEAGIGLELAKNPELAVLWANELTEGRGRTVLLAGAAVTTLDSDPAAAFALGSQLTGDERRQFLDSTFAGWARKDTESALQWAEQVSDPGDRDAAVKAIRAEAPVGIGAVLKIEGGYPVINGLLPGTPAEQSGQLRSGDRILALAQWDSPFSNAQGLPMAQVVDAIRGAPGTVLHLQVLPANAPADSTPRIVSITRDQIKFKR